MLLIVLLLFGLAVLTILFYREIHLEDEGLKESDHAEYNRARLAYLQAQQNFELAEDPQYIDVAISDLGISENRVNNELRKKRL